MHLGTFIASFLVGCCAGTASGMLGIGGGVIMIPLLHLIFFHLGMPYDVVMHTAVATSLMTASFSTGLSAYTHYKRKNLRWDVIRNLSPAVTAGALLGASAIGAVLGSGVADSMNTKALNYLFAVFQILVAVRLAFSFGFLPHYSLPQGPKLLVAGLLIGALAATLGISGGPIIIPFLNMCSIPIRQCAGISAACGFPIAIAGSIGHMITGWDDMPLPWRSWSLGYVYFPTLIGLLLGSFITTPLGARLALILPPKLLKRSFALLLLILAVLMIKT